MITNYFGIFRSHSPKRSNDASKKRNVDNKSKSPASQLNKQTKLEKVETIKNEEKSVVQQTNETKQPVKR